jgi:hypothetical protein
MCILETTHPTLEGQMAFAQSLSMVLTDEDILGSHFQPIPERRDGSHAMRVLVFRRGHGMPGLADGQ